MPPKNPRNLQGQRFGRWVVLRKPTKSVSGQWVCRCNCGSVRKVASHNLVNGISKSCGCLMRSATKKRMTTHGLSKIPEYQVWRGMISRCENPNRKIYPSYGGRGIFVCERWKDFKLFFEDMGPRPSNKHSIERGENDGPYSPENCSWATQKEQCNNTRKNKPICIGGETKTISQWCDFYGIKYRLAWERLSYGWEPKDVFTRKKRQLS